MPKIDISDLSPEDILDLQNQLAKRAKQLSKAKKSQPKPKRVIPDDVDDDWDPLQKLKHKLKEMIVSTKMTKRNTKKIIKDV